MASWHKMRIMNLMGYVLLVFCNSAFPNSKSTDSAEVKSLGAFLVNDDQEKFDKWYLKKPNDSLTLAAYIAYGKRTSDLEKSKALFIIASVGGVFIFGQTMACGDSPAGEKACNRPATAGLLITADLLTLYALLQGVWDYSSGSRQSEQERRLKSIYWRTH